MAAASTIDPQTLIAEGRCYQCRGTSLAMSVKLALLRRIALVVNPAADVSPAGLETRGKCYNCGTSPTMAQLYELALLDIIAGG